MKKPTLPIFWLLVVISLFVIVQFFVPVVNEMLRGPIFLAPIIIFSLTGLVLLILTWKERAKNKLTKFLFLTGLSATGLFVFSFLHNAFYALNTVVGHITMLHYLTEWLHVLFFLISIPICPLGFLIGVIGSIVMLYKKKV